MKAYIDKRKCVSEPRVCQPIRQCPVKAISWIEDDDEPLGSRMELDEDKCIGCGICVEVCCQHCIEMK